MERERLLERIDRDVARYYGEHGIAVKASKFHQRYQKALWREDVRSFLEFIRNESKESLIIETRNCSHFVIPKAIWSSFSDREQSFFRETGMFMKLKD